MIVPLCSDETGSHKIFLAFYRSRISFFSRYARLAVLICFFTKRFQSFFFFFFFARLRKSQSPDLFVCFINDF